MSVKTYYGGQAVMEGVMMRGRSTMAVAVRAPSGDIAVYHETLEGSGFSKRVRPLPFLRGVFMLWDTMILGTRALVLSANVGLGEETDELSDEPSETLSGVALWATVACPSSSRWVSCLSFRWSRFIFSIVTFRVPL